MFWGLGSTDAFASCLATSPSRRFRGSEAAAPARPAANALRDRKSRRRIVASGVSAMARSRASASRRSRSVSSRCTVSSLLPGGRRLGPARAPAPPRLPAGHAKRVSAAAWCPPRLPPSAGCGLATTTMSRFTLPRASRSRFITDRPLSLIASAEGATLRTSVRITAQPDLELIPRGGLVELNLTKRQQEIFDFIRRYGAKYGYPPTVREIGKAVGLASSSTVHAHLANLERYGVLKRNPAKPRALELLFDRAKQAIGPSGLPVVGQVAAGQPILAEENIEEYVQVPAIAGGEEGEYVLRVS